MQHILELQRQIKKELSTHNKRMKYVKHSADRVIRKPKEQLKMEDIQSYDDIDTYLSDFIKSERPETFSKKANKYYDKLTSNNIIDDELLNERDHLYYIQDNYDDEISIDQTIVSKNNNNVKKYRLLDESDILEYANDISVKDYQDLKITI